MMLTYANLNSVAGIVPSGLLVLVWWCALRSVRHSGWGIAMLTLVGTISHEALHAVVGWVFRARPTSFSIIPKRQRDCWVLGSVSFRNLNIWNSAPVAFAPLLLAWAKRTWVRLSLRLVWPPKRWATLEAAAVVVLSSAMPLIVASRW